MIEKEIIKDQKETIHRLQDECTEKTKIILKLHQENEQLKEINLQLQTIDMEIDRNNKYRKALEEIREIAGDAIDMIIENDKLLSYVGSIYNKINEVLDERN